MKTINIFLVSLLLGYFAYGQKAFENNDKQTVRTLLKTQEEAWNMADINAFMKGYWKSDKLVFTGSQGPIYGFYNTLERYKTSYPDKAAMGTLKFDLLFIEQWDERTIQVVGKFTLKRANDEPTGYFTLLFREIDGEWKIVSDHSSSA